MADTWILHLTPEELKTLHRGLRLAQECITPPWRRLAAQVEKELLAGQLDPKRTYQAIAPVIGQVSGLYSLALRIKDAVEIVAALADPTAPENQEACDG